MAFSVQDDNGSVVDANAYIDVAFFNTYHSDRNVTDVVDGNFELLDVQGAIVLASDYLDSRYSYVGERRSSLQTTEWPRFDAVDRDDYVVFGVPTIIKEACADLALAELKQAGSLFPDITFDSTGQGIKRIKNKLDVLENEIEYFGGNSPQSAQKSPIFYQADWRLKRSGLLLSRRRLVRGG